MVTVMTGTTMTTHQVHNDFEVFRIEVKVFVERNQHQFAIVMALLRFLVLAS